MMMDDGLKMNPSLRMACRSGRTFEVMKLLKQEGNGILVTRDSERKTPLHIACEEGHEDLAEVLLIRFKVELNVSDMNGWEPLHSACSHGNFKIIQLLLKKGANIKSITNEGDTPLHIFVRSKRYNPRDIGESIDLLIASGNPVEQKNAVGDTPLHCAASNEIPLFALYVLKHNANPNAKNL
jgi:ankyrin repeat protein